MARPTTTRNIILTHPKIRDNFKNPKPVNAAPSTYHHHERSGINLEQKHAPRVVPYLLPVQYTPLATFLGFVPLPLWLLATLLLITLLYIVATEIAKSFFYRSSVRVLPTP